VDRRKLRAVEMEGGVGVVLNDGKAVFSADVQQPAALLRRHEASRRVLVGRHDVGELGAHTVERRFEAIEVDALVAARDRNETRAGSPEGAKRSGVGRRLDEHGVSRLDERLRNEVEPLRRACQHEDVVRQAPNALSNPAP